MWLLSIFITDWSFGQIEFAWLKKQNSPWFPQTCAHKYEISVLQPCWCWDARSERTFVRQDSEGDLNVIEVFVRIHHVVCAFWKTGAPFAEASLSPGYTQLAPTFRTLIPESDQLTPFVGLKESFRRHNGQRPQRHNRKIQIAWCVEIMDDPCSMNSLGKNNFVAEAVLKLWAAACQRSITERNCDMKVRCLSICES